MGVVWVAALGYARRMSAPDRVAAITAGVLLPFAIYVAFWVLDLGPVAGVGFCVIAPSVIGQIVGKLAGLLMPARTPGGTVEPDS